MVRLLLNLAHNIYNRISWLSRLIAPLLERIYYPLLFNSIRQNLKIITRCSIPVSSSFSIVGHCATVDVVRQYDCPDPKKNNYHIFQDSDEARSGEGFFIGFGAVVLSVVTHGAGYIVSANGVVRKSFGPRFVIAGAPAEAIKFY